MAKIRQTILSATELSGFCSQMAMILQAGIPAREGLSIMREDADDEPSRALLDLLYDRVEAGATLSVAFEESGAFPKYVIDMVEIGEQSGRLDEVLHSLTDYYEREQNIRASIKSAITYPLVMLGMMMMVIIVLATRVLPIFNQVFEQLGAQMSAFARGVLRLGATLGSWSTGIIAALAVALVAMMLLRATARGRAFLSGLFASFPPTRRLSSKIATGRFAGAMSLMLQSGLDPDRSLEMAGHLVDQPVVAGRIKNCQQQVAQGSAFADALAASAVFSGLSARMISVGFKTGAVDTVMQKLADQYEDEIDADLARLVGIVEPTLVAFLSVAVGMILLSVMLPLMGIMSSIG